MGKQIPFLTGYLNSKVCEWYFKKFGPEIGGTKRWLVYAIENILVTRPKRSVTIKVEKLMNQVLGDYSNQKLYLQTKVDYLIYKELGLNSDEIDFINRTLQV